LEEDEVEKEQSLLPGLLVAVPTHGRASFCFFVFPFFGKAFAAHTMDVSCVSRVASLLPLLFSAASTSCGSQRLTIV
jgi:hypothetical protein